MTNTNKRNLIIVSVVLSVALVLTVCVSVFFPRKTIADLLHLTSKDQIESVTLVSYYHMFRDAIGSEEQQKKEYSAHKDITGTPLAQQYVDAIFSKSVVLQENGICTPGMSDFQDGNYKVVTVNLTIDGGDDSPILQTSIPIKCCAYPERCNNYHEIMIVYDYAPEYIKKQFEQGEYIEETRQLYFFTIPGDELFTSAFINEQLGVDK